MFYWHSGQKKLGSDEWLVKPSPGCWTFMTREPAESCARNYNGLLIVGLIDDAHDYYLRDSDDHPIPVLLNEAISYG